MLSRVTWALLRLFVGNFHIFRIFRVEAVSIAQRYEVPCWQRHNFNPKMREQIFVPRALFVGKPRWLHKTAPPSLSLNNLLSTSTIIHLRRELWALWSIGLTYKSGDEDVKRFLESNMQSYSQMNGSIEDTCETVAELWLSTLLSWRLNRYSQRLVLLLLLLPPLLRLSDVVVTLAT